MMLKRKQMDGDYDQYMRYTDIVGLCSYTSLGKNTAKKIGEEAGAMRRIGRRVIYDLRAVDAYMATKNA